MTFPRDLPELALVYNMGPQLAAYVYTLEVKYWGRNFIVTLDGSLGWECVWNLALLQMVWEECP